MRLLNLKRKTNHPRTKTRRRRAQTSLLSAKNPFKLRSRKSKSSRNRKLRKRLGKLPKPEREVLRKAFNRLWSKTIQSLFRSKRLKILIAKLKRSQEANPMWPSERRRKPAKLPPSRSRRSSLKNKKKSPIKKMKRIQRRNLKTITFSVKWTPRQDSCYWTSNFSNKACSSITITHTMRIWSFLVTCIPPKCNTLLLRRMLIRQTD